MVLPNKGKIKRFMFYKGHLSGKGGGREREQQSSWERVAEGRRGGKKEIFAGN